MLSVGCVQRRPFWRTDTITAVEISTIEKMPSGVRYDDDDGDGNDDKDDDDDDDDDDDVSHYDSSFS